MEINTSDATGSEFGEKFYTDIGRELILYINKETGQGWADLCIDPLDIVRCWHKNLPLETLV